MTTTDTILFEQFAIALNTELARQGCGLKVELAPPKADNAMVLLSVDGRRLGLLPDHVDAETIRSFEVIIGSCT